MSAEQAAGRELSGETEAHGEKELHCYFVHHKSHVISPGSELEPSQRKSGK
jgi:hypothetical protein